MKLANEMESAGMYLPFDYHEPSQRGSARAVPCATFEMMVDCCPREISEIAEIDNSPSARKCPGCVEPRHWLLFVLGQHRHIPPSALIPPIHVSFL